MHLLCLLVHWSCLFLTQYSRAWRSPSSVAFITISTADLLAVIGQHRTLASPPLNLCPAGIPTSINGTTTWPASQAENISVILDTFLFPHNPHLLDQLMMLAVPECLPHLTPFLLPPWWKPPPSLALCWCSCVHFCPPAVTLLLPTLRGCPRALSRRNSKA